MRPPVDGRSARRRGRASRRLAAYVGVAVAVLGLLAGLVGGPRPAVAPALADTDAIQIGAAHGSSYVPALRGKRPLFILVMGSDARPGEDPLGQRADVIQLIGLDARRKSASILGFPRDSWVSLAGRGTARINSALAFGGPSLMVRTVESLTGIRIDFWVLTTFDGVIRMVDEVGKLTVSVPYPMHDRFSGSNFNPGKRHLRGWQALAFARDRHSPPDGDFGRSANQQRLLVAAASKLGKDFRKDPASLFEWVAAGWRRIKTDLSLRTLVDLGFTASQIDAGRITHRVVPGTTGMAGAQSVVFISGSAQSLYADMRRDGLLGSG
jgi:polyisoprenyl-teichoic acid--peptidoglycan teichoic acid transferase